MLQVKQNYCFDAENDIKGPHISLKDLRVENMDENKKKIESYHSGVKKKDPLPVVTDSKSFHISPLYVLSFSILLIAAAYFVIFYHLDLVRKNEELDETLNFTLEKLNKMNE